MLTERSFEVKKYDTILFIHLQEKIMQYELIIDNNPVITGSVAEISVIIGGILIFILLLAVFLWKKLRENAHLKYEFITIVAHKFRTPLTYIKWVCDSLIPEESDSFKKKSFEEIKRSNQKIIDLTSTLIEIADSENSSGATYIYEKIILADMVKEVSNKYKDTLHEKNIFYSFDVENDKVKVKVDRSRFEFVLATLLENAWTYTPIGKDVKVTITNTLFKTYISVEDSGIGISKQDLPHVFSKFFRGKNARINDTEGFGVGLYLASSIIKRMHGKIKVESPGEGQGSRFTIILPRVR
jgi:signal transduction histidine kinase